MSTRSLTVGLVVAILAIGVVAPYEPARCADGWRSPSIGRAGACSWHGGVDHTGTLLVLVAGAASGLAAAALVSGLERAVRFLRAYPAAPWLAVTALLFALSWLYGH